MVSTDKEIDAYMLSQDRADPEDAVASKESAPSLCRPDHLPTINNLKNKPLLKGDIWFVVARAWYRRWEQACTGAAGKDGPQDVGPVDNSGIADAAGRLSAQLLEGVTVEYVPEQAWNLYVEW
jgi:ubiquitin carboxyl-terminal hydrolase 4/11